MMDNDTTIKAYNDHIEAYIASMSPAIQDDVKAWIDRALKLIPEGSEILELGSGAGREADYIESQGYKVLRTEAAQGFVNLLRKQGHDDARLLNVLTDDFGRGWTMIFAKALLLHFNPEQIRQILDKSY